MAQDSSRPEFWDVRWKDGVTPWDAGGTPPHLALWLADQKKMKVLIPGCGSGHEVRLFAERGHEVLAIDFSAPAVEAARRQLGPLGGLVQQADFFRVTGPFDLIYERAFLCALPRAMWDDWGRRTAELVRPGGALAGFFYFDDNQRGPPFGIARARLHELLQAPFELAEERAVPPGESIPVFKGKESWQVWKRRL